jgi:hypothetical protein
MLNIKLLTALGIVATVASLATPVSAQSNRKGYTLSGDSLTGINQRTANQDFSIFFTPQTNDVTPVNNNVEENIVSTPGYWRIGEDVQLRRVDESLSLPNAPFLIQPGPQNVNGNDGLQVQFDLTNTNKRKDLK